jgi:membrane fusion protein (multidrug efflux system)
MNEKDKDKRFLVNVVLIATSVLLILVLLVSGSVGACKESREKKAERIDKAIPVAVITAAYRSLPDKVTLPGMLEAWEHVVVVPEVGGTITSIPVKKGDRVKKGQTLLTIDKRSQENAVRHASLAAKDAADDHIRALKLSKTGAVSDQALEKARLNKEMTAVTLAQAKIDLSYCEIKSPMDGVVQDIYFDSGAFADKAVPAATVLNISRVKAVFSVPERDIAGINTSGIIAIDLDALPDRKTEGKVAFVAPAASRASNTYRMEIELDNKDGELRPGMIVRASLVRGQLENVIVVPLEALIPDEDRYIAFVKKGARAERRSIRIAKIIGSEAALSDGLEAEEELIVEGHRELEDGSLVVIATDTP